MGWRHQPFTTKNTLPWWYVFVTVGHVFCHACTSMTILWQNQDSHTCAVVEVFHDITKIIITKVSTSMTINRASWKCFRQGWPTRGIHHNGSPLSYWVRFGFDNPLTARTNRDFPRVNFSLARGTTCRLIVRTDAIHSLDQRRLWYVDTWDGPTEAHSSEKAGPFDLVKR